MAAPRFLALVAGRIKQIVTIATSAGAADAEKVPSTNGSGVLDPTILNAATTGNSKVVLTKPDGTLDPAIMPAGIGAAVSTITASENLAASDLVNIWNDGGTEKVRKADATGEGKEICGYVLAGVTSGNPASVYSSDTITGLSGKTPGQVQYLSTTPGLMTATAPSTAGNVVQQVGVAHSATAVSFRPSVPITLA